MEKAEKKFILSEVISDGNDVGAWDEFVLKKS